MTESTISLEPVATAKMAIRKKIIRKREALSNAKRIEKSLAIAQRLKNFDLFKESKAILFFLSLSNEVQTDTMILDSFRLGRKVFIPVANNCKEGFQVARISSLDKELVAGKFGVREPNPKTQKTASPSSIDFIVTPGLAFDIYGNRIGYGGGYYDKFLKQISRNVIRVGIAFDFQILDLIPSSDFDEAVQFIVTESRTLKCLSP